MELKKDGESMNILIINGSPKGDYSITLQTSKYLELLNPQHNFSYLNAAQGIKAFERDFTKAADAVKNADILIFSYPVYTFLAPYQLHRFIELLKESNIDLSEKWATQISTSKHFYDVTAHRYIKENCLDLKLKYVQGLSADMDDLPLEKGQQDAKDFFSYLTWCIENDIFDSSEGSKEAFTPVIPHTLPESGEKTGDIVIVTDVTEDNISLSKMIERFRNAVDKNTRIVNLKEYPFKGGCLGCLNCAPAGKCVYKDGFDEFLRENIQNADAIVYAYSIKDHSFGIHSKLYNDRQFCNGHRAMTMGKPVGYLIDGPLKKEYNVQTIIEARAQVGHNFLAGVATNEIDPDTEIDTLAKKISYALNNSFAPPRNFYGVGGMKIFRDLIWLMRGIMKADHKFYKAKGEYDFPQKKWPMMLAMHLVGAMFASEEIKKKMGNKMNEGMLMPYEKVLKSVKKDDK